MLVGQLSLVFLRRTNLDDLLDGFAHGLLSRFTLGDVALVVNFHTNGVLHLTGLALLDHLGFTRLQLRVDAHLDLERSVLGPLNLRGCGLALGTDFDDLLDRLGHTLGFGLGVHNLRVHDGLGRGHLVLTQLPFLDSFLRSGFQVLVEDDLGLERHVLLVRGGVGAFSLGTDADLLRGRFLGALRGHGRVTRGFAVHELLGRGDDLSAELTLLIEDLLAGRQVGIKLNLGLERHRLLGLGHQLARSQARTVLDDPFDGFLGGLFLDHLGFVALGRELGGELLLAVLAFLDNPGFTRLQLRVLTNLGRVRDRNRPRDFLCALSRLGADEHDLIDRLLGALPRAILVLLLLARFTRGFSPVFAGRDRVVVLVLDLERNFTGRHIDDIHHRVSSIRRTIFVGHRDRDLDLVAGLRVCGSSCGDLTVVVNADSPTGRNIAQLVGVVLGNVDVVRLVESHRQLRSTIRVHRLHGVRRLGLIVVGQLHHGGDGHLRGGAVRRLHRDGDGLFVTRLGIGRRGGGDDTGARVDLVLPAVDVLLGDRRTIGLLAERERRALRSVGDVVVHGLVGSRGLHRVGGNDVALDDHDGSLHLPRFVVVVVVGQHRHIQDVALRGGPRNGRGDFTGGFVDLDCPRAAVVLDGVFSRAVFEGVPLRGLIGRAAAQAALGERGLQADVRARLVGHRVVVRDLDVRDGLELRLDLVGGLVRVGGLHLRSDDGARRDGVVRLRGDLASVIDGDGPAVRDG